MSVHPNAPRLSIVEAAQHSGPLQVTLTGEPDDLAALLLSLALRWPAPNTPPDDLLPPLPAAELDLGTLLARVVLVSRAVPGQRPLWVAHALGVLWDAAHGLRRDCLRCGARSGQWCTTASGRPTEPHRNRLAPLGQRPDFTGGPR